MQIGKVVGTVVATQKNRKFEGAKLLLVQPESPSGEAKGPTLLAIDSVGVGVGEPVLVVLEGRAAGEALGPRLYERAPERCCEINKVEPMLDALRGREGWVTAFRRDSAPNRANAPRGA